MKYFSFVLSVALALSACWGAVARPLIPAEDREYDYTGRLPLCDNSQVLNEIKSDFRERESGYWNSALGIDRFDDMQELAYRPTGADFVPRRYCRAQVMMSDQKIREVSYSIGEREGFLGLAWGTEWCISGLDRNYAFGIDCRSARP